MTTGEPGLTEELPAPVAAKRASRGKRIVEWFWRGGALAETKMALPEPTARAVLLAQRAHSSADLATNTGELARSADADRGSLATPGRAAELAEASACEFYRQSSYWSLCALAARSDERAGASYVDALWDTLDEQLLTAAAPGDRAEALRTSLRSGSFVYFAELPAAERASLFDELKRLAESLLFKVDERTRAIQHILQQRAWRLCLLLLMLLIVVAGAVWERRTREDRSDLARGAPWRASSKLEGNGCISPAQQCDESPVMFVCTREEKEPWIEFDLGGAHQISSVRIDNRVDCCLDRTIPLIVEVSENHKKWRTVARRDEEFKDWRATFAPVKARWVRLRINRVSFLHLAGVHIYP